MCLALSVAVVVCTVPFIKYSCMYEALQSTPPHVRFGGKSFLKTHPIIKARSRQTHLVSQRQASKRVVSSISSSDRLASRE